MFLTKYETSGGREVVIRGGNNRSLDVICFNQRFIFFLEPVLTDFIFFTNFLILFDQMLNAFGDENQPLFVLRRPQVSFCCQELPSLSILLLFLCPQVVTSVFSSKNVLFAEKGLFIAIPEILLEESLRNSELEGRPCAPARQNFTKLCPLR